MAKLSKTLAAKLAALTLATVGLSGCVYDVGLGYASDGYAYNQYDCDPYAPFDSYYACDSGYGFYNIGFGGGWYDNYYYPGYGYYLFDNYGRRHNMGDHHRRHWGGLRQRWYRDNYRRGDGHHGDLGHDRGRHRYSDNVDQPIAWPEERGGRRSEREGRPAVGGDYGRPNDGYGRGDRRRDRDGRRGDGQGADAVPQQQAQPQPSVWPGRDRRREERRRQDGWGNGGGQQPQAIDTTPRPQPMPRADGGGRRGGDGGGRGNWQPQGGGAAPQQERSYQPPAAPTPRFDPPAPRAAPPAPAPRVQPTAPREMPNRQPD